MPGGYARGGTPTQDSVAAGCAHPKERITLLGGRTAQHGNGTYRLRGPLASVGAWRLPYPMVPRSWPWTAGMQAERCGWATRSASP
jgi:hypothetical protein